MSLLQFLVATCIFLVCISSIYTAVGNKKILKCYQLFLSKKYWTNYNIVEALSWITKAIIIVPGLIFDIHLWYLYFLTLTTSCTLIWASNKKLLPTLVWFNTLWVFISIAVICKTLLR